VLRVRALAEPTEKRKLVTAKKFCGEKGAGSERVAVEMLMKVLKHKIKI
jgi:hypothetical protein